MKAIKCFKPLCEPNIESKFSRLRIFDAIKVKAVEDNSLLINTCWFRS